MKLTKTNRKPSFCKWEVLSIDGVEYRIVQIKTLNVNDSIGSYVILIRLFNSNFDFRKYSMDELYDLFTQGRIQVMDSDDYGKVPTVGENELKYLTIISGKIGRFIESLEPDVTVLAKRGNYKSFYDELCVELCVTKRTVLRKLLFFLQGGGTAYSIMDGRHRMDEDKNKTVQTGKVKGRKSDGNNSEVENDEFLIACYDEAIDWLMSRLNQMQASHKTKNKPTLCDAYNYMIIKHFPKKTDEFGNELPRQEYEIPSYRRFYYYAKKRFGGKGVRQFATSASDAFNNDRMIVGNSSYGYNHPAACYEFDENEMPIVLVSETNYYGKKQDVGKCVVYLSIDAYIGLITGFHVMIGVNNSYEGFLNLMDSILMTDEELAFMCGVPYEEKPFRPSRMVPDEIRVDRGAEYMSNAVRDNLTGGSEAYTLEGIPVSINICPPGTGSMKGRVEGFFSELSKRLRRAAQHGNGVVSTANNSRHYDEGELSIMDARKIVYELVREFNTENELTSYIPELLREEVKNRSPYSIWKAAEAHYGGGVPVNDANAKIIRYSLFKKSDIFRLSREMVSYKDIAFWDIRDDDMLVAKALANGKKREPIELRYDPRTAMSVWRLDEYGNIRRYDLAKGHLSTLDIRNWSFLRLMKFAESDASERYRIKKENQIRSIDSTERLMGVVEEAKARRPEGKSSKKNIRVAAEIERAVVTAADNIKRGIIFDELPKEEPREITDVTVEAEVKPVEKPKRIVNGYVIPEKGTREYDNYLEGRLYAHQIARNEEDNPPPPGFPSEREMEPWFFVPLDDPDYMAFERRKERKK